MGTWGSDSCEILCCGAGTEQGCQCVLGVCRMGGWHYGPWVWGTPYLVDIRHHISGRAPRCTELGGQGLPLLREHTHVWGVHQHRHHAQALLLQRVEHHQEPVGR